MKKDPKIIAEEIIKLVSELATLAGLPSNQSHAAAAKCFGGEKGYIRSNRRCPVMVEEGGLDSPKKLPEIVALLKQEGRHYSDATVSMGLLNLVRERVLTRFKDKGEKGWKYAVRR